MLPILTDARVAKLSAGNSSVNTIPTIITYRSQSAVDAHLNRSIKWWVSLKKEYVTLGAVLHAATQFNIVMVRAIGWSIKGATQ